MPDIMPLLKLTLPSDIKMQIDVSEIPCNLSHFKKSTHEQAQTLYSVIAKTCVTR